MPSVDGEFVLHEDQEKKTEKTRSSKLKFSDETIISDLKCPLQTVYYILLNVMWLMTLNAAIMGKQSHSVVQSKGTLIMCPPLFLCARACLTFLQLVTAFALKQLPLGG